jgi:hypothetical protein
MDFSAMLRHLRFGKSADDAPAPLRSGGRTRRVAALREAGEILAALPGPGESLHAIMTGRYDLTDLIDVILTKRGAVRHLRVATLSFNKHNVQLLQTWVAAGAVHTLTVLCSSFFREHNPAIFEALRSAIEAGPTHHLAAARNHCKVVCFDFIAGGKLVMEGSANLRTNSNREQFCLVADPALHDWHAAWIDEQVTKHEGDTRENCPTR